MGSGAPADAAIFATNANLAVQEAYLRHLADAESLGYRQIAHKLAVDKAIKVKLRSVRSYVARLDRAQAAAGYSFFQLSFALP